MFTLYIAKITNLGQKLGQSINFHSQYTKMRLRNMLKICLVFWKSEPLYAYKRYAYKKTCTCFDLVSDRYCPNHKWDDVVTE